MSNRAWCFIPFLVFFSVNNERFSDPKKKAERQTWTKAENLRCLPLNFIVYENEMKSGGEDSEVSFV